MMNALSPFKKLSGLKWKRTRQKVLASWARLDRLCAKFNNGLAAVAVALLIAVVIADASYIMNAINDLPPISAGGSHVLLGP